MIVPDRVVYRYSATKLVLLGIASVGMSAVSAAVGFGLIPYAGDPITPFICKFGAFFFFLGAIIAVIRLLRLRTDVVSLTPSGITDIRLAAGEIPWMKITGIDTYEILTSGFIVLEVEPAFEATLALSRKVRTSRAANRRLGINGLAASTQELDVDVETMLRECRSRWLSARVPPQRD